MVCSDMCATFGRCDFATGICPCHPNYGYGEGMAVEECQLDNTIINSVWMGTLPLTAVLLACCLFILGRWVRSCNVDWWKVITYRNAPLLFGATAIQLLYCLYAVLRLYANVTAFNDYGATVVFVLAEMCTLLQCIPLADLCHGAFVGVLRAVGVTDGIKDRTWSARAVWICLSTLPFVPGLAAPALANVPRGRLVQYFVIAYIVVFAIVMIPVGLAGENAIKILKSVGTEPTKAPQKKIRLICVNMYILLFCTTTLQLVVAFRIMSNFPYQVAFLTPLKAIALFLPVIALKYDPAVIQGRQRPSAIAKTSLSPPSTTEASSSMTSCHVELA